MIASSEGRGKWLNQLWSRVNLFRVNWIKTRRDTKILPGLSSVCFDKVELNYKRSEFQA